MNNTPKTKAFSYIYVHNSFTKNEFIELKISSLKFNLNFEFFFSTDKFTENTQESRNKVTPRFQQKLECHFSFSCCNGHMQKNGPTRSRYLKVFSVDMSA